MVKFRKGSGVKMPEESVDKGFAGKIGVVMRVPLKQGLKQFSQLHSVNIETSL